MNKDIEWAAQVDRGEITQTELVQNILEDELGEDFDSLMLARRIVAALEY